MSAGVAYFKLHREELSFYGIVERVYTLHPKHARCSNGTTRGLDSVSAHGMAAAVLEQHSHSKSA